MRVAESAVAAFCQDELLTSLGEVGEHGLLILIDDLRTDRHFEDDVRTLGAVPVLAHAVAAGPRLEMLLVAVVDQRIEPVDGLHHDVAAASAVAAAGAAELDEFLAPERNATIATVAGSHIDLGFIKEFHAAIDNTSHAD